MSAVRCRHRGDVTGRSGTRGGAPARSTSLRLVPHVACARRCPASACTPAAFAIVHYDTLTSKPARFTWASQLAMVCGSDLLLFTCCKIAYRVLTPRDSYPLTFTTHFFSFPIGVFCVYGFSRVRLCLYCVEWFKMRIRQKIHTMTFILNFLWG